MVAIGLLSLDSMYLQQLCYHLEFGHSLLRTLHFLHIKLNSYLYLFYQNILINTSTRYIYFHNNGT